MHNNSSSRSLIVARQHQQLQRQDGLHGMTLNGVGIADVEKEILQNIYWLCLSSTTWAFMQIDQPFSILGPDGLPGFPSMDENTSTVLRLDQASGNISTLHSQIQTMRWMWPLSHATSTVAHVYMLYLNTPTKDRIFQPVNSSTLSLEIRDILNQAIRLVEREVTTSNLQSFLLIAYNTIVIYMLFSPAQIASSSFSVDEFCKSTSTLLDIAQRFPSLLPTGLVFTQRKYIASTLALAFYTCSRALVLSCREHEQQPTDPTTKAQTKFFSLASQLRKACKSDIVSSCVSIIQPVKKRPKRVQSAFQSLITSDSPAPSLSLDGELNFTFDSVSWSGLGNQDLGDDPAQFEFADPEFFVDDPAWGSLLRFPGFARISTGTTNLDDQVDQPMPICPVESNNDNHDLFLGGQDLTTNHFNAALHDDAAEIDHLR